MKRKALLSEGLGLEGLSLRLRVYLSRVSSLRFRVWGFRVSSSRTVTASSGLSVWRVRRFGDWVLRLGVIGFRVEGAQALEYFLADLRFMVLLVESLFVQGVQGAGYGLGGDTLARDLPKSSQHAFGETWPLQLHGTWPRWEFPKKGIPYLGVLIIRYYIRVAYFRKLSDLQTGKTDLVPMPGQRVQSQQADPRKAPNPNPALNGLPILLEPSTPKPETLQTLNPNPPDPQPYSNPNP